jgi:hypothetical protein
VRGNPQLSILDGFAFALIEKHAGCILLTGDGHLRTLATANHIEVREVLWIADEIHAKWAQYGSITSGSTAVACRKRHSQAPRPELTASIRRYDALR